MKFKKTLLAAALMITGFSAQAAQVDVKANLAKYMVEGKEYLLVEEVNKSNPFLQVGKFYTQDSTGTLTAQENIKLPEGILAASKGQLNFNYDDGITTVTPGSSQTVPETDDNVGQNNYWYSSDTTTIVEPTVTSTGETIQLRGKLVNPTENGNTEDYEDTPFGLVTLPGSVSGGTTTVQKVKKDIQIGNLTQLDGANTDGLATYDFKLTENKAQGTLATIQTQTDGNTAVASVTGNGLAVLDVAKGGVVDLEEGTVTFTSTVDGKLKRTAIDTTAYLVDGKTVIKIGSDYFTFADKQLVDYTGDKTALESQFADAKGLTDEVEGSTKKTLVNTGLVSNKNVTYGESATVEETAGGFKISVTNPDVALPVSGETYALSKDSKKTTTSKNVVTGILAEDEAGNKTYGLQATTVVDNKVTGQTTVTAEGITTTGTVSAAGFLINGESITSTVDKAVTVANTAIDKKIAEVDSRLTQFNSTADRLNSRINDVKETAYSGVAIALAAQQQVPNIGAGQVAVFGGAGHYEGETAGALGLVGVLADGRTSLSGALGVGGSGDVGGRVGVAYVFGGK